HSWLRNLRSSLAPHRGERPDKRQGSLGATTHRPHLEVLEDRLTPSFTYAGFSTQQPIATLTPFTGQLVAAFNADRRPAPVTCEWHMEDQQTVVNVFLGEQTGGSSLSQTFYLDGFVPYSQGIGDAFGDGRIDVVFGGYFTWAEGYGFLTLFNDGN